MSDFLTNLAARALHAAPVVQPRLATRFEPPQTKALQAASPSFGGEFESFVEPALPPVTPTSPAPPPRQTVNLPSTPAIGPIRLIGQIHKPPASDETRSPDSAPAIREIHRARPGETPAPAQVLSPITPRELPVQPRSASNPIARPANGDTFDRRTSRPTPTAAELPPATTPTRQETKTSPQPRPEPRGPIVAQPRVTSAPPPPKIAEPREIPPAPPPTIHVTIGRIEVRAVTAPAAALPVAPRPAAKSPVTPLDDYLRERSGGRK